MDPRELARGKYRMLLPLSGLHHKLLGWFDVAKREMPWRETRDPYAIWLSETMLQQTQVETVKPYYRRFLERFPTVADLAAAELQDVLSLWAGLGYYRRAKHLHLAAREMVAKHGGEVPGSFEGLVSLPGVGRYTAGAVGSIAFGLPLAVVDGNVMRVISRLTGFDGDIAEPRNAGFFWGVMEEILRGVRADFGGGSRGVLGGAQAKKDRAQGVLAPARYGDLNQAVMELGATVCTPPPGRPGCSGCPVRGYCRAFGEGRVMELPVKRKKGEVPVVRGVALVVTRNAKHKTQNTKPCGDTGVDAGAKSGREVLVMRRAMGGVWEGMWEFPIAALKLKTQKAKLKTEMERWAREEMGILVTNVRECGEVRHHLTHRLMVFEVVRCEMQNAKHKTQNTKREERDTQALRHGGTEGVGKTRNAKRKTQNREAGVILPVGATMGGGRYVEFKWVGWPLEEGGGLPLARVVWKVAEAAEELRER